MAGMLGDARAGHRPPGTAVRVLLTEGTPGIFAYKEGLAR
jgi:hypothetical protein